MAHKRIQQREQQVNSDADQVSKGTSPLQPDTANKTPASLKNTSEKIGSYSKKLMEDFQAYLQTLTETPVSLDDARESLDNLINLNLILADDENIFSSKHSEKSA